MRRVRGLSPVIAAYLALGCAASFAQGWTVRPEVGMESRWFLDSPQLPDQFSGLQNGLILGGRARWESDDRQLRVNIEPYVRYDSRDSQRRYADWREAHVALTRGNWDFLAGVDQVFWGVTESRNVVNVINQSDAMEDIDGKEKLGQPMLRATWRQGSGALDMYYMPYFRERRFASASGRLRTGPVVDDSRASFERSKGTQAGDWALRYKTRTGDADIGLHAFSGTNREPFLRFEPSGGGFLKPEYQRLRQIGLDAQYTTGALLLKAEIVRAKTGGDAYSSAVAGFEYTFSDVKDLGVDVGLIGELLYDNRNPSKAPATVFEKDFFVGTRLTINDVNDTEFLIGAIIDKQYRSVQGSATFKRRLAQHYVVELESRWFAPKNDPLLQSIRNDNFLLVRLTRYFD